MFLPASIRNFLDTNVVTDTDNLIYKPSMQALAMSRQFTFFGGLSAPGVLVGLAAFPLQSLLLAWLLDAALLVVVLRVGSAPLTLHLPLQATDGLATRRDH